MEQATTRREALGGMAAGVALAAAQAANADGSVAAEKAPSAEAAEADGGMVPIVDPHQHLWDFKLFRPPWLSGATAINKSTTMADYLKATAGLNVRKTVYMEVDVDPKDQMKEAKWVEGVCAGGGTPMAAGVVSCRPGQPGFEAYVRDVHKMKHIRGFRQVLHGATPRGYCTRPEFVRDIQMLGRLGMTWDLCMRPAELADAAQLVEACPDTRFILDHCGNGPARNPDMEQWKRDIGELAKRDNVVCKISGVITTVHEDWDPVKELEPVVLHCIESFGIGRAMFAGDWPVCTLRASFAEWVNCLKAIVKGSSAADQRKLFHDNAAQFYRIA